MRRALLFLFIFAALRAPSAHAAAPSPATHHSAPAPHQVHIVATQLAPGESSIDIGATGWTLQGYDLRDLLARVYDVDPARIDVDSPELVQAGQDPEAAPRYDVSLALNGDESDEAIQAMLRSAVEERFHLKTTLEKRSREVYVLTAPSGPGRGLSAVADLRISAKNSASGSPSMITVEGRICPGISSAGITAKATTIKDLAAALEDNLDRVVLDETHLTPAYDFHVPQYSSPDELFSVLHEQLGLTVRTEQRAITVLAVHGPSHSAPVVVAGI